jgi:hypothetical protein
VAAERVLGMLLALGLGLAPVAARAQEVGPIFAEEPGATGDRFSFFVIGHAYGAHTQRPRIYGASPLPAASLLANLDILRRYDLGFFTGDVVQACGPRSLAQFKRLVADRLTLPIFNAKGNHDNCPEYNARHKDRLAFSIHDDRFVILPYAGAEQVDFLTEQLQNRLSAPAPGRIFVFSHRPIWTNLAPDLHLAGRKANIAIKDDPDFTARLAPLLRRLNDGDGRHRLYWFSGDVGSPGSYPVFFHRLGCCVQLLASGLNDDDMDNYLRVEVSPDVVRIEVQSLTGRALEPLESYDVDWLEAFYDRR